MGGAANLPRPTPVTKTTVGAMVVAWGGQVRVCVLNQALPRVWRWLGLKYGRPPSLIFKQAAKGCRQVAQGTEPW
jgi:hypothetical protein